MENKNLERILELERKRNKLKKLHWKDRKELQDRIDDEVVFYNPKKRKITVSGGGIVSLWFRYIEGNKKWLKKGDETNKKIIAFEKKYKLRLSCKDLDNSVIDAKLYKNSFLEYVKKPPIPPPTKAEGILE